ncbi:unnamed protein product [Prorocentrum cordatum]|uniref:Uncharacterized protein n=1 Tax=Prorocentrum cordatum TaxID=2364126 RepID=A0ABN9V6L8_9DINO|nr:unnamed protein product [Polarella glacialis]
MMAPAFRATVALLLVAPGGAGRALPALQADSSLLARSTELRLRERAALSPPARLQLLRADAQIAQCLQRRRADPTQIAATVQQGLSAVMGAVKHFMMQPPEVEQGLDVLGKGLLEAISEPIREQYSNATAYAAFEQEWMGFFETAVSTTPAVQGNITLFQEEGRPDAVIMAISDILWLLSEGVVRFVPHETAQEVAKYVDAVGDLLGAVGASWEGFGSGQEAQAIEDLYFALRGVLDQVLPEDLRNDETYKLVIGTLDGVIYSLSETVLDFQRQIVEGTWKVSEEEPEELLQEAHRAGTAGGLERAVAGKVDGSASGKQPIPDGAMVALCEETGNYTEKIGHWCYAACPAGMASVGLQCKTQCQGEFPADDGAMMCGHNPGVLAEAVMNMVIGVATGAINSGLLIASMAKDGVDTDSLVNTIQAFVNMGKPFAYQTCPLTGR